MAEVAILIPHISCIPWCIYNNVKLYSVRNKDFMKRRVLSLVLGFNFALILVMLSTTISTIGSLWVGTERSILFAVNTLIAYFTIFFLNVRNWIIYYRYHFTHYTLQLKWQQLINANILEKEHKINWFIKNNYRFGNLMYIYKLFGSVHLIGVILVSISVFILPRTQDPLLSMLTTLIPVITTLTLIGFYFVIVTKTPVFKDTFYIYWENRSIAKILLIGYILFFILSGVHASIGNKVDSDSLSLFTASIQLILLFMWMAISYLSTKVITKKNAKYDHDDNNNYEDTEKAKERIKLESVLTNPQYIDLFMRYLSKEFSMENMLAFIEFTQFQQCLMDNYKMDGGIVVDQANLVRFPINIPLSLILEKKWSDDELHDIKIKANMLYKKYVAVGSEFEINISYEQREAVRNILGDLDMLLNNDGITINDLFGAFNESKGELWQYLLMSLSRYKTKSNEDESTTKSSIFEMVVIESPRSAQTDTSL